MEYSLISLVLEKDGTDYILAGWVFDDTDYKAFTLTKNWVQEKLEFSQQMRKDEFKSADQFIGVMGKFKPFLTFFEPIKIKELTFSELLPHIKQEEL